MKASTDRTSQSETLFWAKVAKSDGCWLWQGARSSWGYGVFGRWANGKRTTYAAHKYSWVLANGAVPDGLCVLHHCDVRHCVNPAHLYVGTKLDNARDKVQRGRHIRGEASNHAKLTEADVREIRAMRGKKTQRELAAEFNIDQGSISHIWHRHTWRHVI